MALGHTALKFDPAGQLLDVRPAPAQPRGARALRTLRPAGARGRRRSLRPALRHARPVHALPARSGSRRRLEKYDPLWFEEPTPPEMPEEMARVARGDVDPDRDRRAPDHEVRVLPRARDRSRCDPAAEPGSGRRPARGEEDRRHGRGALRPDRTPPLLRPGRRCREHPAQRLQPELPRARGDQGLGRLPRRDPEDADRVGGRLRHSLRRRPASASSSTRRLLQRIRTTATSCT